MMTAPTDALLRRIRDAGFLTITAQDSAEFMLARKLFDEGLLRSLRAGHGECCTFVLSGRGHEILAAEPPPAAPEAWRAQV